MNNFNRVEMDTVKIHLLNNQATMKTKYLHWIEYEDNKHYLSIWKKAPWDNRIQIRLPKAVCSKLSWIF